MDITEAYIQMMLKKPGYSNQVSVLEHLNLELNKTIPHTYLCNWSNPKSRRNVPRDVAKYMRRELVFDFVKRRKLKMTDDEVEEFSASLSPTLYEA